MTNLATARALNAGSADLNANGTVEGGDLATMLGAWGNCP
jgi:hypothetical protein